MISYGVLVLTHDGAEVVLGRLTCTSPDLGVVDALARFQLAAKRIGCTLLLREPADELGALLWLAGLAELFGELGR